MPLEKNHRQKVGRWGEEVAALFLQQHGLQVVARNFRTPYGELDIIACQGSELVFVEVKTRTSQSMGPPEVSVTESKAEHLLAAVETYMQDQPVAEIDWRIDVIAVIGKPGNSHPQIEWFQDALS